MLPRMLPSADFTHFCLFTRRSFFSCHVLLLATLLSRSIDRSFRDRRRTISQEALQQLNWFLRTASLLALDRLVVNCCRSKVSHFDYPHELCWTNDDKKCNFLLATPPWIMASSLLGFVVESLSGTHDPPFRSEEFSRAPPKTSSKLDTWENTSVKRYPLNTLSSLFHRMCVTRAVPNFPPTETPAENRYPSHTYKRTHTTTHTSANRFFPVNHFYTRAAQHTANQRRSLLQPPQIFANLRAQPNALLLSKHFSTPLRKVINEKF